MKALRDFDIFLTIQVFYRQLYLSHSVNLISWSYLKISNLSSFELPLELTRPMVSLFISVCDGYSVCNIEVNLPEYVSKIYVTPLDEKQYT